MSLFLKLRVKMYELGVDQSYLSSKIGLGITSISLRMTCKREWSLSEMYAVMDLIQEPYEKLHEYFPKDGGIVSPSKGRH